MSYILGFVSQVKQAYLGSLFGLYGEGNISDPDTTKTNPDATKTTSVLSVLSILVQLRR